MSNARSDSPAIVPTAFPRTGPQPVPERGRFSFVMISDRAGGIRPGVFERGLAVTDLLAPSFAIQIGDLIQGYTDDPSELGRQWSEVDTMFSGMRTPVFHVPGNHDVSTPLMERYWLRRFGSLYFHWRFEDVLFVVLNTQDPAEPMPAETLGEIAEFEARYRGDVLGTRPRPESAGYWNGVQPARLSEPQLEWVERVLHENADVRWTFLAMHMPLWQGDLPAWSRIRRALAGRSYHAFAGHVHNYRSERDGRATHVRLGPTGGGWVLTGPEGNFDHVTQVTVTDRGPVVVNVLLEGIRDLDGQPVLPVATRTVPIV